MSSRSCKGTTRKGTPCKATPLRDEDFCLAHSPRKAEIAPDFQGRQPGAGRPKRPREIDLIEQVAEEKREELRAVYSEGLVADRAVVVGQGPTAHVEHVPDHPHRHRVAESMIDRLHGKARQVQEIGGLNGAPITVASTFDMGKLSLEEKRQLLETLEKASGAAES